MSTILEIQVSIKACSMLMESPLNPEASLLQFSSFGCAGYEKQGWLAVMQETFQIILKEKPPGSSLEGLLL
ncbi:UNVERIFIED_CONTAM: hypothetical protein K2H54_045338 [Gekko kuhli]